jgi:hypothetical protein
LAGVGAAVVSEVLSALPSEVLSDVLSELLPVLSVCEPGPAWIVSVSGPLDSISPSPVLSVVAL